MEASVTMGRTQARLKLLVATVMNPDATRGAALRRRQSGVRSDREVRREEWRCLHTQEMRPMRRVALILPALNEEQTIGDVVRAVPRDHIPLLFVVDNGSSDRTAAE